MTMTKFADVSEFLKLHVDTVEHPDVLIAYLRYALEDVRKYSDRSTRHLEAAIASLSEDASLFMCANDAEIRQRPS
jgi:hypothetical protein